MREQRLGYWDQTLGGGETYRLPYVWKLEEPGATEVDRTYDAAPLPQPLLRAPSPSRGRKGGWECTYITSVTPSSDWLERPIASDWSGSLPSRGALRRHFLSGGHSPREKVGTCKAVADGSHRVPSGSILRHRRRGMPQMGRGRALWARLPSSARALTRFSP